MAKATVKTARGKQNQAFQSKGVMEEKLRLLNANRSTTTASVVARRDEPNDYGDMSEQSHEEWLFLNLNKANTEQYRQITEALERIKDGSYGVCAECEKPISPKRLQAVPWAKYCVPCQEQRGSWNN
jgi:DnaK suppressor protein